MNEQVCLLGGSNSIVKDGFSKGLGVNSKLNFAIGGSSSVQNIHALVSNSNKISNLKVIVSESNINDIFNVVSVKYPMKVVLDNIEELYHELYLTGKFVAVIIIPRACVQVDEDIIINDKHRELCKKYGFQLLDLSYGLKVGEIPSYSSFYKDNLHPLSEFSYALGFSLKSYLRGVIPSLELGNVKQRSNYLVFDSFGKHKEKHNSRFRRDIFTLDGMLKVDINDAILCGVESWSDEYANIIFEDLNTGDCVVKMSNDLLSFNEIVGTLSGNRLISSDKIGDRFSTEVSALVENDKASALAAISSLLFKINDVKLNCSNGDGYKDLNFLIPSLDCLKIGQESKFEIRDIHAVLLRDIAVKIESIDIGYSLQLMKIASLIRPKGPLIRNKVEEYTKILRSKSTKKGE